MNDKKATGKSKWMYNDTIKIMEEIVTPRLEREEGKKLDQAMIIHKVFMFYLKRHNISLNN